MRRASLLQFYNNLNMLTDKQAGKEKNSNLRNIVSRLFYIFFLSARKSKTLIAYIKVYFLFTINNTK